MDGDYSKSDLDIDDDRDLYNIDGSKVDPYIVEKYRDGYKHGLWLGAFFSGLTALAITRVLGSYIGYDDAFT